MISPEVLYGYENRNAEIHLNQKFNAKQMKIWFRSNKTIASNHQHKNLEYKINLNRLHYVKKEEISFQEELFLKPDPKFSCVAKKLNIPKSHLTDLFKNHSTISFIGDKK